MKIFFKQNYAFKQTKTTIQNDKMDQNLEKCMAFFTWLWYTSRLYPSKDCSDVSLQLMLVAPLYLVDIEIEHNECLNWCIF